MTDKNSQAYDYCSKIALEHYENFPVGSILIPKNLRKHFYALYAFMRTADDFADLPHHSIEERLGLLAEWRRNLDGILTGQQTENPVFIALANTIKERNLDAQPLYKLLEAFEFDAKGKVDFDTFDDLRWYTSRSAEPVGILVLALFGYRDAERIRLSNDICTALQLINFIQDRKEDYAHNRDYYPKKDQESLNNNELSLFELKRIESLLNNGALLSESVRGRLRYELRAVIHAARKMISKIRKMGGDTISQRPTLTKREHGFILMKALLVKR